MDLREWLKQQSVTGEAFAKRIRVSQGAVSKIMRGAMWPNAITLAAIERETKGAVTASDVVATYRAARSRKAAPNQRAAAQ